MKILFISNNPSRASFRQRIGIYLDALQKNGINCTVEKLPSSYLSRWRILRKAANYDGVVLHKKALNLIDAVILAKSAKKIIYDFDDAMMFNPSRPHRDDLARKRKFERTIKIADCVIAGNSYLAAYAAPFCKNLHILGTGLDVKKFSAVEKPASDGKIRLVWIGSKSTLGYLKMLSPVLEEIPKRFPNVVLRIICDEFFESKNIMVEKHFWSLETEAADLIACDLGLSPLPDDRFTRGKCGFKILQYFAAGLPVVASPVGVNVEFIQPAKTGFIADTPQQWLESIVTLIENVRFRRAMGAKGRMFAENFDTDIIGKQFCRLIINCINSVI